MQKNTNAHAIFCSLLLCGLILGHTAGFAQTGNLPACQGDYDLATWTKCFGKRVNPNGDVYVGDFLNGVAHGKGTYSFPSGTKYVGEYKYGRRDGAGTEYRPDGSVRVTGTWAKGVLQKEPVKLKEDQPVTAAVTDTAKDIATEPTPTPAPTAVEPPVVLHERKSLLEELLTRRWRLSPTLDCQKGEGSYSVYDKREGRYFVNNGLVDKAARQPEVDIKEVDADHVVILINYWATPLIEKALHESKVFATQLELTLERDRQGKITETERAVLMDARAAMEGIKKFKNELPEPTELLACEGESFASETDNDDRYNGLAKLRCDVNVDCASQDDVLAKIKIRGERGLKTNQPWAQACVDLLLKTAQQSSQSIPGWSIDLANKSISVCNGKEN